MPILFHAAFLYHYRYRQYISFTLQRGSRYISFSLLFLSLVSYVLLYAFQLFIEFLIYVISS